MVYLQKRKTAFQHFAKISKSTPDTPTPIFRSSSKQPEGTSDSFCGGRSHLCFIMTWWYGPVAKKMNDGLLEKGSNYVNDLPLGPCWWGNASSLITSHLLLSHITNQPPGVGTGQWGEPVIMTWFVPFVITWVLLLHSCLSRLVWVQASGVNLLPWPGLSLLQSPGCCYSTVISPAT